jgi:hypothetical protein
MASVTILSDNGATSGSAGLKTAGGNDGTLLLQTTTAGGTPTTAISISNTQVVTFANQPTYTGGTANGVLYLNGSKAVTSGSALVFDGTNLGLGATPSAWGSGRPTLEFSGATQPAIAFMGNVTNGGAIWTNAYYNGSANVYKATGYATRFDTSNSGAFGWFQSQTSGTAGAPFSFFQAMTLDASGNLGLGATPSAWSSGRPALEFGGTTQPAIAFNGNNGNGGAIVANAFYNGSNWIYKNSFSAALYQNAGGSHAFYTAPSGTSGNAISFTQAMTLDASGRFMVGTTSPATLATFNTTALTNSFDGATVSYNNSTSSIGMYQTGTSYGYGAAGASESWIYSSTRSLVLMADGGSSVIKFATGGSTERMRISAAGVVTQPYQPIVAAYRSGDLTGYNTQDQALATVYNATEVNIGSRYSTSTGLFTAPATGTYMYYASAYTGGPATLGQVWTVQNGNRGRSSSTGPANDVVVGTGTVYMASGDTLGVHFYGTTTNATIASNDFHTFLYIYFLG